MNDRYEQLYSELRRRRALPSRELLSSMGISAPTLSRLLTSPAGSRVIRIGRARATRYALRRDVRGMGSEWPLYAIAPTGQAERIGQLHALSGGNWYLEQETPWPSLRGGEFPAGLYPGLPWFLQDLRPRGFMGRRLARRHAAQYGVSADPRDWSDDDVLLVLLTIGNDLPGAFVLGRRSLESAQAAICDDDDLVSATDRVAAYPAFADAAMAGDVPGSSAAGEQPKFTARLRNTNGSIYCVITKFSGAKGRPEDRRWRDLLIAEHVANAVLTEAGITCADTEIIESKGRCFLQSTRFDRCSEGGRRGLVSLEALDCAFFGQFNMPWDTAAERYRDTGWLSPRDADRLALLWWFGVLIGNTDMHYGNASLFLEKQRPLTLAPTYDMVPMAYRPDAEGNLREEPLKPVPPPPEAASFWPRATELATLYWDRLAETSALSCGFRAIASRNAQVLLRI